MKSFKTIQTLAKIGKILRRIALVCAMVGGCGCIAGLAAIDVSFDNDAGVVLGIAFLVISLFCRCGAEKERSVEV